MKTAKEIKAKNDAQAPAEKPYIFTAQDSVDRNNLIKSLTMTERHQIQTLAQEYSSVHKWLKSVRYEIENNMSSFDWLKMYAHVLGSVDMNDLIEDYHYTIQR